MRLIMARSPMQVIVIPYRKEDDQYLFAVFKRSPVSGGFWQWIAGGAEDDETPSETAKREVGEEAGITVKTLYSLDTIASLQKNIYDGHEAWSDDLFVVPEYSFALCLGDEEIIISDAHAEYRWVSYDEATQLLLHDSNKTALWELRERLRLSTLQKIQNKC